jgi:hypothetical protein
MIAKIEKPIFAIMRQNQGATASKRTHGAVDAKMVEN